MKNIIILTVVLLAGCSDKEPDTVEPSEILAPVINNSGYQVHIDPATGEFLPSPPPKSVPTNNELPTASSSVKTTKPEQLKVIPSDVPNGGHMIDLKGRFMTDEQSTQASD